MIPQGVREAFGRIWGPAILPRAVRLEDYQPPQLSVMTLWRAWRSRSKRRRFLARAYLKRREITAVADRTAEIQAGAILGFACIRDEAVRLPYFLDYHRKLGVDHFLIVDNASSDGSGAFLRSQPDVSLWHTTASYRGSRFGIDWLNHLLARHGNGHWCLTLDADELFVYPHCDSRDLRALTGWLERRGQASYGALLVDLYPKGPVGAQDYRAGDDPLSVIPWFDPAGYRRQVQPREGNLWVQGGPRDRMFFRDAPERAPTLNKVPLVRWHWRQAYVNSTHSILPPGLNDPHRQGGGVLLHTKFLPGVVERAGIEKARGEHFGVASQYADYYDRVIAGPDFWHPGSARYEGWQQFEALGLLSRGGWY
jgi:hypothetical protein